MTPLQAELCATFEAMPREIQMDTLQKQGVYIGKLKEGDGTRLLYQYQSIYVEVIYAVHRMDIKHVHCFIDTVILDRYFASSFFDTLHPD